MTSEKRNSGRSLSFTEVSYDHLGAQCQGRISDLSPGGFFIDTINPLPEGSLIRFRFLLPGSESQTPIKGDGVVAWQRPMEGMGIRFRNLLPEDRARISDFLSRD